MSTFCCAVSGKSKRFISTNVACSTKPFGSSAVMVDRGGCVTVPLAVTTMLTTRSTWRLPSSAQQRPCRPSESQPLLDVHLVVGEQAQAFRHLVVGNGPFWVRTEHTLPPREWLHLGTDRAFVAVQHFGSLDDRIQQEWTSAVGQLRT